MKDTSKDVERGKVKGTGQSIKDEFYKDADWTKKQMKHKDLEKDVHNMIKAKTS